jgi:hypothetical protein
MGGPGSYADMKTFCAAVVLLLSGCAHVSLDQAVTAHNVFRQMLLDASDSYSTMYRAAAEQALANAETADKAAASMKPYDAIVAALRAAQAAEQTLHVELEQCVAWNDENCDSARLGFACAATALDLLSTSYGQVSGGAYLYAATAVAKAQLTELAHGATCEALQ